MNLKEARVIAEKFTKEIAPFCERVEVVGSIRREKQLGIEDIDILLIPISRELYNLYGVLRKFGVSRITTIARLVYEGAKIELHFSTPERWLVDLVVTTGGEESNKRLAKACHGKKYHLSVSKGQILDDYSMPIPLSSEKDVFEVVGLPYLEPRGRD